MTHAAHAHTTPTPTGFQPHTVAHHFDTAEQEFQSAKMAFWLFLATEVLLFGGMFAAYFYYHGLYHETFTRGGQQLNWRLGALNTIVLLVSSYTMAMAVRSAQLSLKKTMLRYLSLTLLCALAFLVVKFFEYSAKYEHGLLMGRFFTDPHGVMDGTRWPNMYFAFYFTMTGIHGLHVLGGVFAISWLLWRGSQGRFHSGWYLPVDVIGLYWHIVDLIWIFLFPLLYLVP